MIITDCEIIKTRLNKVRDNMKRNNISVYVVPTGDYHISEYPGDYFKEREFITGFTGSAGTAVISMGDAALFTDGRYYVQAERQIKDTGFRLMRSGLSDVPSVSEYCRTLLKEGDVLGFDGKCVEAGFGMELEDVAKSKGASVDMEFDGIESIYTDRPSFPHTGAYYLEEKYSGETIESKLKSVRRIMAEKNCDCHIIASLDDICWLYNIRGNDVWCNPVIMSYGCIFEDEAYIYTDEDRLNEEILDVFQKAGVRVKPYESIYNDVVNMRNKRILIDNKRVNVKLLKLSLSNESCQVVQAENPEVLLKSKKNKVEIDNLTKLHVDDGVALTKFMCWLKKAVKSGECVTEVSAAQYLDNLRSNINDYIELSFDTISAYNENAAQLHYHATKDNCAVLKPEGMLLVDSGGQYLRGTTDVTRTISLGPVSSDMIRHYTLTLKGMLNLASAKFLKGCTGFNLDVLARAPLWNEKIDYRCGTGHGIGYLLNVHEGSNGFRWKHKPGYNDLSVFEPGMVTSDEPGVYIEDKYGIRIENEILCVEDETNEYGTWLQFKFLTLAPFDMELIDVSLLERKDIEQLNNYNSMVYEKLSPYMNSEELEYLKANTATINI